MSLYWQCLAATGCSTGASVHGALQAQSIHKGITCLVDHIICLRVTLQDTHGRQPFHLQDRSFRIRWLSGKGMDGCLIRAKEIALEETCV